MSDGGDCRTAPATPGLLMIACFTHVSLNLTIAFPILGGDHELISGKALFKIGPATQGLIKFGFVGHITK